MTTCAISCYDVKGLSLHHYFVDEPIYIYIKQLESYIRNPVRSKLNELYGFRFGERISMAAPADANHTI